MVMTPVPELTFSQSSPVSSPGRMPSTKPRIHRASRRSPAAVASTVRTCPTVSACEGRCVPAGVSTSAETFR